MSQSTTTRPVRATFVKSVKCAKQERFGGNAVHAGRYGFLRDGMR